MVSRISHVSVDCVNAYELSTWWSRVLDLHDVPGDPNEPGDEECMIVSADGRTRVLFIQVPDVKVVKNRLHFDLRPVAGDRDTEIERVLALGAQRVADHRRKDGRGWLVLADPEGNEFCVLRSDAEVAAQD